MFDRVPTKGGFDELWIKTQLATMKQIHAGEARIVLSTIGPNGGGGGLVHMTVETARRVRNQIDQAINAVTISSPAEGAVSAKMARDSNIPMYR